MGCCEQMSLHGIDVVEGVLNHFLDKGILVLTRRCVQDKLVSPILQRQMLGIVMLGLRLPRVGVVESRPI